MATALQVIALSALGGADEASQKTSSVTQRFECACKLMHSARGFSTAP